MDLSFTINKLQGSLVKVLLSAILMMGTSALTPSFSQGWEIYFGGNKEDQGVAIIETADKGLLAVGYSESFGDDNDQDVYVIRTDVDGSEIWSKVYDEGFIEHGYGVIEAQDGGYIVVGDIRTTPLESINAYLLKIDEDGQLIWSQQYGGDGFDQGLRVSSLTNGGYLIVGKTVTDGNEDILLIKTDVDGNEIWTKTYGGNDDDFGTGVVEVEDGYLLTGQMAIGGGDFGDVVLIKTDFDGNVIWEMTYGSPEFDGGNDIIKTADGNIAISGFTGNNSDIYVLKLDLDGNEIWSQTYGGAFTDIAYDMIEIDNGDLVIVGVSELSASELNICLLSIDSNGNENWFNTDIGRSTHTDIGQGVTETSSDKGFAIVGYNALGFLAGNDVSIITTNANGDFYSNHLQGKVFVDELENCDYDPEDAGLNDWLIKAESDDLTFFGSTDAEGNFDILVDTGVYTLSVLVKNDYWMPCVEEYEDLEFDQFYAYDTLIRNFPMFKTVECPLMEIDISSPVVQNCSNIGYQITYCNDGTITEENGNIQITLDEDLEYLSSTIPLTNQIGNILNFEIDPIEINQCDTFSISVSSSCEGQPNEAYLVEAQIMPDTFCIVDMDWNGASIDVNGICEGDSILFEIENIGDGGMDAPQPFIVVEDIIIQFENTYELGAGEKLQVKVPANGSTYRLIAEQVPDHPGNKYPTKAVEGCIDGGGDYQTGSVTIFQEDENEPTIAIDVQEAVTAETITQLDIRGYPKGYPKDGKRLIPANTDIEYHLLFHNSGTDTAKRVVIRDTLSSTLDISSVRPGASSHDYDFQIYDTGILKFTFDNIHLTPDGSASSYGYVKFKVSQKPNLPIDTEIRNSAAIYLGYDLPFDTDNISHFIGGQLPKDFIITDVETVFIPELKVNAYPNPFLNAAVIEIEGESYQSIQMTVFDSMGRQVREEKSSGSKIEFLRNDLPSGTYVFQLYAEGQWIASGKLLIN